VSSAAAEQTRRCEGGEVGTEEGEEAVKRLFGPPRRPETGLAGTATKRHAPPPPWLCALTSQSAWYTRPRRVEETKRPRPSTWMLRNTCCVAATRAARLGDSSMRGGQSASSREATARSAAAAVRSERRPAAAA
jgi:hypothetical protein